MKMDSKKDAESSAFRKKRSRILYEITALVVVVLIASGLVTFFLVRGSQDRLIDQSIDKLVESEAENISSGYDYVGEIWAQDITDYSLTFDLMEIGRALINQEPFEVQTYTNGIMIDMVEEGLLGIDLNMLIMADYPALLEEPILYSCSDESLIYNWEAPDYLIDAILEGTPYIYMEDGIPELGREGEQLIVIKRIEDPQFGYVAGFVGFKSMHDEVSVIEEFYAGERNNMSLTLGLVVFISALFIILITFLVLSYLIRKRITEPIDELSTVAEEVMEGNLDVEVKVHEGGEFEGLERAFKQMVESFREYIAKSVGEEPEDK
jgi:HAMP domain-containing protein